MALFMLSPCCFQGSPQSCATICVRRSSCFPAFSHRFLFMDLPPVKGHHWFQPQNNYVCSEVLVQNSNFTSLCLEHQNNSIYTTGLPIPSYTLLPPAWPGVRPSLKMWEPSTACSGALQPATWWQKETWEACFVSRSAFHLCNVNSKLKHRRFMNQSSHAFTNDYLVPLLLHVLTCWEIISN